jgi:cobalt/nickel transport system permease protein
MHISEGVLSMEVLITGAAVTAGGTAVGLRKLDMEKMPRVAVMTAAFFVTSLIHVPLGPSSVHLLLIGLIGILLGWTCFPAILIGLLLQALLFQFGGLTVLGVNTAVMAVPALVVHLLFSRLIKRGGRVVTVAGAVASGALAVLLSSLLAALALVFSGNEFTTMAKVIVLAHLPIMGVEAAINTFVILLLKKVKPEVLEVPYAVAHKA